MKQMDILVAYAIQWGHNLKRGNLNVRHNDGITTVSFNDDIIAVNFSGRLLFISNAGHHTKGTRDRLNAVLLGFEISDYSVRLLKGRHQLMHGNKIADCDLSYFFFNH